MFHCRRLVLAVAVAALPVAVAAQTRPFQSSDVEAPDHPAVRAVAYMGELMRQHSNGRLTIGNVGAADRSSEIFTVAQVRTGAQDMARLSVSALHGSVPATVIPTLPFLFVSAPHRRRVLDGPVGEALLASLAAYDLIGLCFYDVSARSIYTVAKPIRAPSDMKGLKIRVQPSPVMAELMQALGATPVPIPYGQVRARLAAGTIDAAENNLVSYHASRHHEVAKVYSLTEHAAPPAVVIFSKRVWDQLAVGDQEMIRKAARDSVPFFRKLDDEQEAAARSSLSGEGVQFVTDTDRAAFVRALAPLYPRLVPDPRNWSLIELIQASE
jgi:tripartite ATP-independent transporter DctP family solute receptor